MSYTLTLSGRRLTFAGPACRLADRAALSRQCPRCAAAAGEPCVYVARGIHRDRRSGEYVWNVPGQPMMLTHVQRRRGV